MGREHSGAAHGDDDTYVPRNMPAVGDLFDLFNFGRHREYEPFKCEKSLGSAESREQHD
jgi:hypothetical protein